MVIYKGQPTNSRPYERLGEYTRLLEQRSMEYKHHLNVLADNVLSNFKCLKEDYSKGDIDLHTYQEHLRPLLVYLENKSVPHHQKVNVEEIQSEIKKHFNGK